MRTQGLGVAVVGLGFGAEFAPIHRAHPDIGRLVVADHAVAALDAVRHVACTVPMASSFTDLGRVLAARRRSGTTCTMMETAVFTREYLLAEHLATAGRFGTVALARGAHFQDMSGWPAYCAGLPPTHSATHAVAPILRLLGRRATRVRALGSAGCGPSTPGATATRSRSSPRSSSSRAPTSWSS